MNNIAAILTCYNRKNKTISCLKNLFAAYDLYRKEILLSVYITDDGSTDGTADSIINNFTERNINIIKGTGSLYWAGGMRYAWKEALKNNYDGYLLLNDDTNVMSNIFGEIINTNSYCFNLYKIGGIYIGTTCEKENINTITYGGSVITNRWKLYKKRIIPNGKYPQKCELGNGNIMYVSKDALRKIGIFHESFTHACADYDYTLLANKNNIPVLVTFNICGYCDKDHLFDSKLFAKKSIVERFNYAFSPKGLAFSNYLVYMKRNFIYRLPFVYIKGWMRILFPIIVKKEN